MSEQGISRSESMRRGIYILPNLFTTGSLFAGFYGMISGVNGDFRTAAICILAIWDCVNGLTAYRVTMTYAITVVTLGLFAVSNEALADKVCLWSSEHSKPANCR